MIRALTSWPMLCGLLLAQAGGMPAATGAGGSGFVAGGTSYISLTDWARAHDLKVSWLKRDETLELARPGTRVRLDTQSTAAEFNGVQVRLLYPLMPRDGRLHLSQLDALTTFRPLLVPPRARASGRVQTVCLDAGHGGKEPGLCVGVRQEKTYTLLLAQELRDQLRAGGFKVVMTRTADKTLDLAERPAYAARRKADVFISLHFNATEGSRSSVKGAEVYCLTPAGAPSSNARGERASPVAFIGNRNNDENMFLAYQIQKALASGLAVEDRGVHRARFAVLRDASMPAVLIEAGFMSHPAEGKRIFTAEYRAQIARAILTGLKNYRNVVAQRG